MATSSATVVVAAEIENRAGRCAAKGGGWDEEVSGKRQWECS